MKTATLTGVAVFVVLVSSVSAQALTQQQREGQVGIRLLDAPVDRSEDPRALTFIIDHLNVGATIERRVLVANTTDRDLDVDMYPGAAEIQDATWSPLPGRAENELTSWIDVSPSVLAVPAGGEATANVAIQVPGDATAGEHYAVVWAEPPAGDRGGVSVVNRVGVRIYLSVGGGGEPASDFVVDTLQAARTDTGEPVVTARVENTGGRALDLSGELTLSNGPGGLSAGPFEARLGTTLAPGDEGDVLVPLDPALPPGPWLARLALSSGLLERAAEATITFPDEAGTAAEPVAAEEVPLHQDRGFLIPLALGLTLLTLLLLLLFWFFFIRRRDDQEEAERRAAREQVPQ